MGASYQGRQVPRVDQLQQGARFLGDQRDAALAAPTPTPGVQINDLVRNVGLQQNRTNALMSNTPYSEFPMPNAVSNLTMGAGQAQNLMQNALANGGASIQDIIARVAANRRLMQSSLQTPSGAVGYMGPPPTNLQRVY